MSFSSDLIFFSQNLSSEIRLGKISAFLLYPFKFINYQLSLFLSDKFIQFFIGVFSLLIAVAFGWVQMPSLNILMKAGVFILTVSAFWFLVQTLIGFIAFWLEETWSINISIRFISAFLSGAIIPLDLYPEMFAKFLLWTPFPYLIYVPVRILMGESVNFGFFSFYFISMVAYYVFFASN